MDSASGGSTLVLGRLLEESRLLEALHTGLPLRIRVVVELWRDEIFDDSQGRYEWRASVVYDPLARRYTIRAGGSASEETTARSLPEARAVLERRVVVPLRPGRPGRYYYQASLQMETLSLTDLEELQRWLQGELAPAVEGDEPVEGALARGLRRLLVQMLRLPARRYQVRSDPFRFPPAPPSTPRSPPGAP